MVANMATADGLPWSLLTASSGTHYVTFGSPHRGFRNMSIPGSVSA